MAAPTALPAMPERTVRLSEDNPRASSESERRRMLRNSYQSAKSVHNGNTEPIIEESPSAAESSQLRPASLTPSARRQSQWQPPHEDFGASAEPFSAGHSPNHSSVAIDQNRPTHDRRVSGDYPGPTQDACQHRNDDMTAFFAGRPRQRASGLSQDNVSMKGSLPRYAALPTNHQVRRPVSMLSTRQNPWEVYDPDAQSISHEGGYGTPSKMKPKRRTTSFYVVREGGDHDNEVMRLPFTEYLSGSLRNHFVAFLGEFVGTTMFLWFAFAGTKVANVGAQKSADSTTTNATVGYSPIVTLYVSISFGFSLLVNVWVFFRVSGGLFNPAVTLGMVITKTITMVRGLLLFVAQILGAIFASFLVQVMFSADFNIRTTLAEDTSVAQGVFIEMVLTAELVFTVFMLAKEKHKATFMAPIGIGMALFIAQIVGVFFTGGSLNPARSFGPCVVAGKFDPEHWIYWVGPCCGTLVAYAFYRFIKILEYEMANPGQDHTAEEAEAAASMKKAESFA